MLYRVVMAVCFVLLILEVLYLLANVIFKKRRQRITFIRGFKNGKFAVIYLTAIPLYWIGHIYAKIDTIDAFFLAVNKIINLVVLKYDVSSIEALMKAEPLYREIIYFCFVLVGINAILFTISLSAQHLWSGIQKVRHIVSHRDRLYLFGNNPRNVLIYKSDKKRNKAIIDNISDSDAENFYMDKISYISTHSLVSQAVKLVRLASKRRCESVFIINTEKDEENINLCRKIIEMISALSKEEKERMFLKIKIYVFGDSIYRTIYEDIVSDSFGCIHYVNKYQKIAMDFIDRYPLTLFMNENQIDYSKSLVKAGVNINFALIGFGRTNQEVFLTSVANNQFLTEREGKIELKKVNYHIFDKEKAENNKNLNHSYYRFKREVEAMNEEDYLPLPTVPAEEFFNVTNINDRKFYPELKEIINKNKMDANFVLISFGSDLENLDMAQKLVEKRREWELDNLIIFVKVRKWHKEQTLLEQAGCYFIGNERDVVYDIEKIMNDKIFRMAKMRNEIYDLESAITKDKKIVINEEYIQTKAKESNKKWHLSKSQLERDSSLYGCLSIRSKLNLMNLDYCPADSNSKKALTEKEYLEVYASGDMPDTKTHNLTVDGKKVIYYNIDFADSRRKTMAIHEHQRWNSFMISRGTIPASKKLIAKEQVKTDEGMQFTNGRNYDLRRHGNLTTFDGLVEFRQIVALRDKIAESKTDVIKYDYQLLDDAYWLLTSNGYKIVAMDHKINSIK